MLEIHHSKVSYSNSVRVKILGLFPLSCIIYSFLMLSNIGETYLEQDLQESLQEVFCTSSSWKLRLVFVWHR